MIPDGRFLIAFGDEALNWDATFTRIDEAYGSVVTSYQIDRGRVLELDRTDTGRATVEIADRDGVLDPTNPDGPFYTTPIEPLLQAVIQRQNPVNGLWYTRFRGWIDDLAYDFDPSQQVNRLTIQLTDMFGILGVIEMLPGQFGVPPPAGSEDQIFFEDNTVQERINQILGNALGPTVAADYSYVFSGNVRLWETVYSPGETVLSAIQEAADGEWPGLANVATDRTGRLFFHGRLAKLDPEDTEASQGEEMADNWDFIRWKAGDHAAVNADPVGTAHLRRFGFDRGLSHVINSAYATPSRAFNSNPLTAAEQVGQQVRDATSIGKYGIRSWSATDLLTKRGLADGEANSDLVETKLFADYYVLNYATPRNRATECAFRSMRTEWQGATKTWELMSKIDISDAIQITVGSPGGGGFDHEEFFVEGIHEQVQPANQYMDDVTLSLDLSPAPTHNPYE